MPSTPSRPAMPTPVEDTPPTPAVAAAAVPPTSSAVVETALDEVDRQLIDLENILAEVAGEGVAADQQGSAIAAVGGPMTSADGVPEASGGKTVPFDSPLASGNDASTTEDASPAGTGTPAAVVTEGEAPVGDVGPLRTTGNPWTEEVTRLETTWAAEEQTSEPVGLPPGPPAMQGHLDAPVEPSPVAADSHRPAGRTVLDRDDLLSGLTTALAIALVQILVLLDRPFSWLSPAARHMAGYAAVATLIMALIIWMLPWFLPAPPTAGP